MELHDEDFLKGVGERLEGFYPGLSERIDRLNDEQLGRAIVLKPIGQQSEAQLVGYILSVDQNQSEHVILFKTGDILVTKAENPIPGDSTPVRDIYIAKTSPSEEAIEFHATTRSSQIIQLLIGTNLLMAQVTLRNDSFANLPQILEKVDQAIKVASEVKANRDKAKRDSAESVINKLDQLFKPPQNPQSPTDQPPPLNQP